jgi:hypothetical protein
MGEYIALAGTQIFNFYKLYLLTLVNRGHGQTHGGASKRRKGNHDKFS